MSSFDHITTLEQAEMPIAEGGMSMGEGRRLSSDGEFVGTAYEGCPRSTRTDGRHEFVSVANLNSVEHFKCAFGCGKEFWD